MPDAILMMINIFSGALLPFTLEPGMAAIDATRNGVKVADNDHVIFIVFGNIPLKLRCKFK